MIFLFHYIFSSNKIFKKKKDKNTTAHISNLTFDRNRMSNTMKSFEKLNINTKINLSKVIEVDYFIYSFLNVVVVVVRCIPVAHHRRSTMISSASDFCQ